MGQKDMNKLLKEYKNSYATSAALRVGVALTCTLALLAMALPLLLGGSITIAGVATMGVGAIFVGVGKVKSIGTNKRWKMFFCLCCMVKIFFTTVFSLLYIIDIFGIICLKNI